MAKEELEREEVERVQATVVEEDGPSTTELVTFLQQSRLVNMEVPISTFVDKAHLLRSRRGGVNIFMITDFAIVMKTS